MQLLIEARYIPDGTTVYKKTGEASFVIRDTLKLFTYGPKGGAPDRETAVKIDPACKIMVDGRGNVNVVAPETVLRIDLNIDKDELDLESGAYDVDIWTLADVLKNRLGQEVEISAFTPQ